jgi:multiple sugar transport system permease protein
VPSLDLRRPRRRRGGTLAHEGLAGWAFVAPVVALVVVFLVVPIVMAAWVSVSDWTGRGSPFSAGVRFVGAEHYRELITEDGLSRQDLMVSLRNNFYYVVLVVPLQTGLALFLAVVLNRQRLVARGFFRTAFYFPSVTSAVAISIVFLFLFGGSGVVNAVLAKLSIDGPTWFGDPDGVLHIVLDKLGVHEPPPLLADHAVLGQSWWEWLAGPSVAMVTLIILAVWTTTGGLMLLFLAALQAIPAEIEEAAVVDGTNAWQRFWRITVPMLRPTLFLVLTLGLIGAWQVFDQIYIISQGEPAKTTLTPAFLSYQASFKGGQWGQGAAISFILFAIIVLMTIGQRILLRDRDKVRERRRQRQAQRRLVATARSQP